MKLELEEQEIVGIINVMGQLPTSSDAWPLVQKIKFQVEEQKSDKAENSDSE